MAYCLPWTWQFVILVDPAFHKLGTGSHNLYRLELVWSQLLANDAENEENVVEQVLWIAREAKNNRTEKEGKEDQEEKVEEHYDVEGWEEEVEEDEKKEDEDEPEDYEYDMASCPNFGGIGPEGHECKECKEMAR